MLVQELAVIGAIIIIRYQTSYPLKTGYIPICLVEPGLEFVTVCGDYRVIDSCNCDIVGSEHIVIGQHHYIVLEEEEVE